MTAYTATIRWRLIDRSGFTANRYSRGHTWSFDGGVDVPASSSPHVVPIPMSIENAVDPEEAFVASVASCHMLWFLSIAAERGLVVDSYVDHASGVMREDADGRLAITAITLSPEASFSDDKRPSREALDAMHDAAHARCFIANSIRSEVRCRPITS